jgi:transposase, IS30 family
VEMDTVIGRKGGKTLLTLFFRNCSLMVAILLDANTQEQVIRALDTIYESLGHDTFKSCFPIILTDNGSEFQASDALEKDKLGNERTKVFYCEPMASYQKPHIERNHEYIRYILPKGRSFDHLIQDQITLMMNHINSTARAGLNRQTPYRLAEMLLGESFLKSLSLKHVHSDAVHLKPALLK